MGGATVASAISGTVMTGGGGGSVWSGGGAGQAAATSKRATGRLRRIATTIAHSETDRIAKPALVGGRIAKFGSARLVSVISNCLCGESGFCDRPKLRSTTEALIELTEGRQAETCGTDGPRTAPSRRRSHRALGSARVGSARRVSVISNCLGGE